MALVDISSIFFVKYQFLIFLIALNIPITKIRTTFAMMRIIFNLSFTPSSE